MTLLLILGTLGCSSNPSKEPGVSLELAQFRKATISDITYSLYFNIPAEQFDSIEAQTSITFDLNDGGNDIQLECLGTVGGFVLII